MIIYELQSIPEGMTVYVPPWQFYLDASDWTISGFLEIELPEDQKPSPNQIPIQRLGEEVLAKGKPLTQGYRTDRSWTWRRILLPVRWVEEFA
jgi:hypothetical protein